MTTKINVIYTPQMVYATYHQTICFQESLTWDNAQCDSAKMRAKASAFSYGQYYGSCMLQIVEVEENWNEQDVFNFLAKQDEK